MKLILTFEGDNYFLVPHLRASEYVELARQHAGQAADRRVRGSSCTTAA